MATSTDIKILKILSELKKEEGSIPLLLQFYRKLLLIQTEASKQIGNIKSDLTTEVINERILKGHPLVRFAELNLDLVFLQELFATVADVFYSYPQLFSEAATKLRKPIDGRLLTKKDIESWFNGEKLHAKMPNGISETLMQAIIQSTLKPLLTAYADTLITSIDQERWRRIYCPICGGKPDIAFLTKDNGARWLLCSRCDSEWLSQRLQCPYCGTQNQNELRFFTDERGQYRLQVCDRCKCYLKTVDLRQADVEISMPLERLLTAEMDMQARKHGYRLPDFC